MVIGTLTETYYDSYFTIDENAHYSIKDPIGEKDDDSFDYETDDYDLEQLNKRLKKIQNDADSGKAEQPKWRDAILFRLKKWARKLENAPKPENGIKAKLLYHIKAFIGKLIRNLTNIGMRIGGTYKRWANYHKSQGHTKVDPLVGGV